MVMFLSSSACSSIVRPLLLSVIRFGSDYQLIGDPSSLHLQPIIIYVPFLSVPFHKIDVPPLSRHVYMQAATMLVFLDSNQFLSQL